MQHIVRTMIFLSILSSRNNLQWLDFICIIVRLALVTSCIHLSISSRSTMSKWCGNDVWMMSEIHEMIYPLYSPTNFILCHSVMDLSIFSILLNPRWKSWWLHWTRCRRHCHRQLGLFAWSPCFVSLQARLCNNTQPFLLLKHWSVNIFRTSLVQEKDTKNKTWKKTQKADTDRKEYCCTAYNARTSWVWYPVIALHQSIIQVTFAISISRMSETEDRVNTPILDGHF